MPEFEVFIDRRALERLGLRLCDITSPYQVWNNKDLKEYESYVLNRGEDSKLRRALMADPNYVGKTVSCGN